MGEKTAKLVIVSASRRTDIPAFYAEWFMRRVRAGYCTYPNPVRSGVVHRVSLRPQDVAGFVFWTRQAQPLIPHLDELDAMGFSYYFLYSLLNYPQSIEPHRPSPEMAVKTIKKLSDRIGSDRVIWRYDPIILTPELTPTWHRQNFETLLRGLNACVKRVIVSVVDPYHKTRARIGTQASGSAVYEVDAYWELLVDLVRLAGSAGITLQSCAEPDINVEGITKGGCVDADIFEQISGLKISHALHRQRSGCLCHRSVDIGVNNSCGFGCAYCYATRDHNEARAAMATHTPDGESITG